MTTVARFSIALLLSLVIILGFSYPIKEKLENLRFNFHKLRYMLFRWYREEMPGWFATKLLGSV